MPIANFVPKCSNAPVKLFVLGRKDLLSHEGTTQGDPTAVALTPLLKHLAT